MCMWVFMTLDNGRIRMWKSTPVAGQQLDVERPYDSSCPSVGWLVDQLFRSVGQSIDQSVYWLVDWSVGWTVNLFVSLLVVWSVSRSVGQSVGRSVGQLVSWLVGQLVSWSVSLSVGWMVCHKFLKELEVYKFIIGYPQSGCNDIYRVFFKYCVFPENLKIYSGLWPLSVFPRCVHQTSCLDH